MAESSFSAVGRANQQGVIALSQPGRQESARRCSVAIRKRTVARMAGHVPRPLLHKVQRTNRANEVKSICRGACNPAPRYR